MDIWGSIDDFLRIYSEGSGVSFTDYPWYPILESNLKVLKNKL